MKKIFIMLAFCLALCCSAKAQSDTRITGILTTTCSNASTSCSGTAGSTVEASSTAYNTAFVTSGGTFGTATVTFELSDDGGTVWYLSSCTEANATDTTAAEHSKALSDNGVLAWFCPVKGSVRFRTRASGLMSGAVNIGITLTRN